jgi:hypothetical protein
MCQRKQMCADFMAHGDTRLNAGSQGEGAADQLPLAKKGGEGDDAIFADRHNIRRRVAESVPASNLFMGGYAPFMPEGIHHLAVAIESDGLLPSRCLLSVPVLCDGAKWLCWLLSLT